MVEFKAKAKAAWENLEGFQKIVMVALMVLSFVSFVLAIALLAQGSKASSRCSISGCCVAYCPDDTTGNCQTYQCSECVAYDQFGAGGSCFPFSEPSRAELGIGVIFLILTIVLVVVVIVLGRKWDVCLGADLASTTQQAAPEPEQES